jgi:hypothetical protein
VDRYLPRLAESLAGRSIAHLVTLASGLPTADGFAGLPALSAKSAAQESAFAPGWFPALSPGRACRREATGKRVIVPYLKRYFLSESIVSKAESRLELPGSDNCAI